MPRELARQEKFGGYENDACRPVAVLGTPVSVLAARCDSGRGLGGRVQLLEPPQEQRGPQLHDEMLYVALLEECDYKRVPLQAVEHGKIAPLESLHEERIGGAHLLELNKRGGRDQWGGLAPLMLAGGGLNMGQVIGHWTHDASEPRSIPVTIKNFLATVFHTLLDVGELRVTQGLPPELVRLIESHEPIPGLH